MNTAYGIDIDQKPYAELEWSLVPDNPSNQPAKSFVRISEGKLMHFVILTALLVSGVKTYTTSELGLMAASEFVGYQTKEVSAKLTPFHKTALAHFRTIDKGRLRKELEPVYQKYGLFSMQGCGAAYVMAMRGIDLENNVQRLRKAFVTSRSGWEFWLDIPEAMEDIYLRHGNQSALEVLIMAPSDAGGSEAQGEEAHIIFAKRPVSLVRYASRSPAVWNQLVEHLSFGGYDDQVTKKLLAEGFGKLRRSSDPKIRSLGIRLKKAIDKANG
jgi:hypothetical protein